jgi:hypothetical protein
LILPCLISGQICPKAKPISYYQVKTACQSMVRRHYEALADIQHHRSNVFGRVLFSTEAHPALPIRKTLPRERKANLGMVCLRRGNERLYLRISEAPSIAFWLQAQGADPVHRDQRFASRLLTPCAHATKSRTIALEWTPGSRFWPCSGVLAPAPLTAGVSPHVAHSSNVRTCSGVCHRRGWHVAGIWMPNAYGARSCPASPPRCATPLPSSRPSWFHERHGGPSIGCSRRRLRAGIIRDPESTVHQPVQAHLVDTSAAVHLRGRALGRLQRIHVFGVQSPTVYVPPLLG